MQTKMTQPKYSTNFKIVFKTPNIQWIYHKEAKNLKQQEYVIPQAGEDKTAEQLNNYIANILLNCGYPRDQHRQEKSWDIIQWYQVFWHQVLYESAIPNTHLPGSIRKM